MASRTLDQILADINAKTDPQRSLVLNQIADIPKQQAAEEAGLKAQEQQGYTDILDGARRRGLGFSGIPLGEQAQYHATQYLPAAAKLRTSFNDRQNTLQGTLASLDANNYAQANDIYNQELARELERQKFDYQRQQDALDRQAAVGNGNSSLADMLGGGSTATTQAAQKPAALASQRANGGFNFQSADGKSISAAKYAQLTGQDIRDVLYQMGQSGDAYSAQLYNQIVQDPFFTKNISQYAKQYAPIFWGTA